MTNLKKNKKQIYLLIIFFVLIILTALILFFNQEPEVEVITPEEEMLQPIEKVNIDFDFLEKLKELNFVDFFQTPPLREKPGRSNPFLKQNQEIEEEN